MARWFESANEASFKPVSGGYIFQSPNPWLFARPRYYIVNDAQKAAIMPALRQWRITMIVMAAVMIPAMVAAMVFMQLSLRYRPIVSIAVGSVLVLIPLLLIPHLFLMRALVPLLTGLPRTDQRFTWSDQFERVALAAPRKMLILGGAGGVLMVVGGLIGLADVLLNGNSGTRLLSAMTTIIIGLPLTAYFFSLLKRKARLVAQESSRSDR